MTLQTDGIQQGLHSDGKVDNPSNTDGDKITLTREELQRKIKEAADAQHSKLDTRIAALTKQLESATTAIKELEEAKRKVEIDALGDAPDAAKLLAERHKLEDERRKVAAERASFEADKLEHDSLFKTANSTILEREAERIATEKGIKKEILLQFGGDSPEKLLEYADSLVKAGLVLKADNTQGDTGGLPRPGSAGRAGPSEKTEEQKLAERYPTMVKK